MRNLIAACAALLAMPAWGQTDPADWDAVLAAARGQEVHWNAWGGSTTTNDFIAWVGERVAEEHGVTLTQVKLADTAEAVSRVLAEKQAGRDDGRRGRPHLDQRPELRGDEGGGAALRPVRRGACRTGRSSTGPSP